MNLPFEAHVRADEDDFHYADLLGVEAERIARAFAAAPAPAREEASKEALVRFGMVGVALEWGLYECPGCGRLLVVRGENVDVYTPVGDRRGVLRSTRPEVRHKPPEEW